MPREFVGDLSVGIEVLRIAARLFPLPCFSLQAMHPATFSDGCEIGIGVLLVIFLPHRVIETGAIPSLLIATSRTASKSSPAYATLIAS